MAYKPTPRATQWCGNSGRNMPSSGSNTNPVPKSNPTAKGK